MNKITLTGRLTADPELKQTPSGNSVTTFTIAVNRRFSKEKTCDFIPCVAWEKTAEFVSKYFRKGYPILVCGDLRTRTYEDKHKERRTAYEVNVSDAEFFSENRNKPAETPALQFSPEPLAGEDDLPF